MSRPGSREPQQDRSRATRRRLLTSAVSCLAEYGWAGSTVTVVAERAGMSRGAAQHHFPTREDLFEAAIEYMVEVQLVEITSAVARLPTGGARTEAVVDMFVNLYTGELFRATLHLWVAASADERLRARVVPLEAWVGRAAHRAAIELLGVDESAPGVRETVQATLDLARGLGLANVLTDDSRRRRRIVKQWAATLDQILKPTP